MGSFAGQVFDYGYDPSTFNDYDQQLLNEIALWDAIRQRGGIDRVCDCIGIQYDEPWLNMPGNGKRFQWIQSIQVSATTANNDVIVLRRKVPFGFDGTIASLVVSCTDPAFINASGQVTWRLQVNDYWVPDCGAITSNLGNLQAPFEVGFVRLTSDQLVTFYVNVSTAGEAALAPTSYLTAALIGWTYPRL